MHKVDWPVFHDDLIVIPLYDEWVDRLFRGKLAIRLISNCQPTTTTEMHSSSENFLKAHHHSSTTLSGLRWRDP